MLVDQGSLVWRNFFGNRSAWRNALDRSLWIRCECLFLFRVFWMYDEFDKLKATTAGIRLWKVKGKIKFCNNNFSKEWFFHSQVRAIFIIETPIFLTDAFSFSVVSINDVKDFYVCYNNIGLFSQKLMASPVAPTTSFGISDEHLNRFSIPTQDSICLENMLSIPRNAIWWTDTVSTVSFRLTKYTDVHSLNSVTYYLLLKCFYKSCIITSKCSHLSIICWLSLHHWKFPSFIYFLNQ